MYRLLKSIELMMQVVPTIRIISSFNLGALRHTRIIIRNIRRRLTNEPFSGTHRTQVVVEQLIAVIKLIMMTVNMMMMIINQAEDALVLQFPMHLLVDGAQGLDGHVDVVPTAGGRSCSHSR